MEMETMDGVTRKHINENAHRVQNQVEYQRRYEELVARFEKTKTDYDE